MLEDHGLICDSQNHRDNISRPGGIPALNNFNRDTLNNSRIRY